jgi:hypothetical protein
MVEQEEGVTDDVIVAAIANFQKLSERRGSSRLEREAFGGMGLMLTLMQRDHGNISDLRKRVDVLEKRNIVTWVINNPRVSAPILFLLLVDLLANNIEAIKSVIGVK